MRPGAAARMGQEPSCAARTEWGNCRKKITYFEDYDSCGATAWRNTFRENT